MTDEKQIERMAKAVSKNCDGTVGGRTCFSCRLGMFNRCIPFEYAKRFYKANGRILPENSVVLTKEELNEKYVLIDVLVQVKEELEFIKRQLKIKTDEAEWRADQLQALDKDFEVMEKVVKCKNCKWLQEQHYEENGEKPYVKLVCKLTKRQCQLNDFCSYGEAE